MTIQIVILIVVVAGFFAASLLWGEDSRIDFNDPRRRDGSFMARRGDYR